MFARFRYLEGIGTIGNTSVSHIGAKVVFVRDAAADKLKKKAEDKQK